MVRVLQVLGTTGLGGAESRVMDLYRHIDKEQIQFDFLVTKGTKKYYENEIESLGGHIYYLPPFRIYNYLQYRKACKDFFYGHKGEYAAVHGHMTSTASIYLPIAKKSGVPLTIAHARSAGVDPGIKGKLTRWLRRKLPDKCDMMLSCSDEASVSVFGKAADRVRFMPNAIDTADFVFDKTVRDNIRDEYNINDRFVIGHVGSFRYAKNHDFILKIFDYIVREWKKGDAAAIRIPAKPVLMLLGDGELKPQTEEMAKELGISEDVIFTGNKTPVAPFYHAFDVLLFPSHYEGMPGTVVEAEAAGLPSLISDKITAQAGIMDIVTYMSLDEPVEKWAGKLVEIADVTVKDGVINAELDNKRRNVLTRTGEPMSDTMYDVNRQADYYTDLYIGAADNKQ